MTPQPTSSDAPTFVGDAAGVPVILIPPSRGPRPDAPVVLAWHLLDPPRNESSFAAALPLDGLDAWRIYIGLPLSGKRLPVGGQDELMRLGSQDAVMNLYGPTADQAQAEIGPVLDELRERFDIGREPVGALGGSMGAAVAMAIMAAGIVPIDTAVLVSPMIQLRPTVAAVGKRYGIEYPWTAASNDVADRLDFIARSAEIIEHGAPRTLLVVGEDDDVSGFREPAAELQRRLAPAGAQLRLVPGMGHDLAAAPGDDPAPQTPAAITVDALAVDWFRQSWAGAAASTGSAS